MVHALNESWRVLKQGGWLIDIRPYSLSPPVEVVMDNKASIAGPIDSSAGIPDDEAADSAIKEVIRDGAYSKSEAGSFKFAYYWDTLDHMVDYIEERWSDSTRLPKYTLEMADRLVSESKGPIKIRIRSNMKIVRYKKQGK
jgi:hypothetical protein